MSFSDKVCKYLSECHDRGFKAVYESKFVKHECICPGFRNRYPYSSSYSHALCIAVRYFQDRPTVK